MANTYSGNVIFCDTSAAFPQATRICGIKYLGAATSSATVRGEASATGTILWSDDNTTDLFEQVEIRDSKGIYVALTGTATVFIYLKD